MANALSNPYEVTVGGITCKASPFGAGQFIANRDLETLGDKIEPFKKALFDAYEAEQSKELEGIKVFFLKPKK